MEGVVLKPNDRIIFGTNSAFLFKHPNKEHEAVMPDTPDNPITFEAT